MTIEFHRNSDFIERRRQARAGVSVEATVRERGRTAITGQIIDFSAEGCRIESGGLAPAGSHVWVRLPGLESQGAWITWSTGSVAGISFERPLHPAVAARFMPAAANDAAPTAVGNQVLSLEPLLSRREQIIQGVSGNERSPLIRSKQPTGRSLGSTISRQVRRVSEHRHETRYSDGLTTGPMELKVHGQTATVADVSRSGLGIRGPISATIGEKVSVEFTGAEPIEGRIVWRRPGLTGLTLPPESIDLNGA